MRWNAISERVAKTLAAKLLILARRRRELFYQRAAEISIHLTYAVATRRGRLRSSLHDRRAPTGAGLFR